LKYAVYQRRTLIDAMKTKAMILAALNQGEKAADAAQRYFELILPSTRASKAEKEQRSEAVLRSIEELGPLRLKGGKLIAEPER